MNFVITGASTGIGYQLAFKLAIEGHTVFAIARRKDLLEKLSKEVMLQKPEAKIYFLAGDITNDFFTEAIAKEILQKEKFINILINNAGTLINKPFEQLTSTDWKDVYSTNVFAVVDLIRKEITS
jgi:short-subunit dehydrogenase